MKEFDYIITDPFGIHARPAGLFAKEAATLDSTVSIVKDGNCVDTRRLMALMQLNIKQNDRITIRVEGGNESKNAAALLKFLDSNNY